MIGIIIFVYYTRSMGRNSAKKSKKVMRAKLYSTNNSAFGLNSQDVPITELRSVVSMGEETPNNSNPDVSNPTVSGDKIMATYSQYSGESVSSTNLQSSSTPAENSLASQALGIQEIFQQEVIEMEYDKDKSNSEK